jgi:hypothetical protein
MTTAIVGVAFTVIPAAPAMAASTSGKGSNPNSPFCKLERATRSVQSPVSAKEKAVAKNLVAGN